MYINVDIYLFIPRGGRACEAQSDAMMVTAMATVVVIVVATKNTTNNIMTWWYFCILRES